VRAWWSGAGHGDQRGLGAGLAPPPPVPAGLRPLRLTQVHGAGVLAADATTARATGLGRWAAGPDGRPPEADALVGSESGHALVVLTADCAPLALAGDGRHGAVHVGWRGLAAGIVEAALGALGAGDAVAAVGPCIHRCCYAFSPEDLHGLAARYGDEVRSVTTDGAPALDLLAGLRAALGGAGVALDTSRSTCTGCGPDAYSFRRRRDEARQALFVWRAA
jgi:copper oxidase (laccase) domain-containing protein